MSNASDYRERPSSEIDKEQKELAKLRLLAQAGGAHWSWDKDVGQFQASPTWVELTGYKAEDVFPEIHSSVQIENLLDSLVDGWLTLIHPNDRDEIGGKLKKFLVFKRRTGHIVINYRLRKADETYIYVESTLATVWEDGRIQSIFGQPKDISSIVQKYSPKHKAAIALEHNREEIKTQKSKVEKLTAELPKQIRTWGAVFMGSAIALNEVLSPVSTWLMKRVSIVAKPVEIRTSHQALNKLLFEVDEQAEGQIRQAMRNSSQQLTVSGGDVKLKAYFPITEPDEYPFPDRFFTIMTADQESTAPELTSTPRHTNRSAEISKRTEFHVGRSPYLYVENGTFEYSFPIRLETKSGFSQVLFVSVTQAKEPTQMQRDEINSLAERIRLILESSNEN